MSLTLTVLSFKNQPVSEINIVSIGNNGGTIGRSDDNSLVLPDTEKFVSRHHATIKMEGNYYYLTDTSLSGITITGQEGILHNATKRLDNGMLLSIGQYDIVVAIATETVINDRTVLGSYLTPNITPSSEKSLDSFSANNLFSESNREAQPASAWSPTTNRPAVIISDIKPHYEENSIKTEPMGARNQPNHTNVTDGVLFNAFLQGVAIDCNDINAEQQVETLHRIGQMFRKLIDGTINVLRNRAEFKNLFHVNMTVIKATNNNPLKFTISTDDVLRQLLENKTGGFLASTIAIEEAFDDIINHQLAMQAGIEASLTDLLTTFNPKIIEKQFEQGLVLQKKSKCWDSYEETYRVTAEDAVENFFGEAFLKAYEQEMSLLTQYRKKS